MRYRIALLVMAPLVALSLLGGVRSSADVKPSKPDLLISAHAQQMIEEGRQIFRYDTFGSEAFWGDALQLHKAIAGEKHGGLGGGVSPKTALSVGLKVDVDALPAELQAELKAGKVDLDATGLARGVRLSRAQP